MFGIIQPRADMTHKTFFLRARYLPDLIKGDLDSLRDDTRAYYEAQVRTRALA